MAGNKNAWRDIFSPAEWAQIRGNATVGAPRARPLPARPGGPPVPAAYPALSGVGSAQEAFRRLTTEIRQYDLIPKDYHRQFKRRIPKLRWISALCAWHREHRRVTHSLTAKSAEGKATHDQIDVWVQSLGHRALKKANYLEAMHRWHIQAKGKYKGRQSLYHRLWELAVDNTRPDGSLHATPYATAEKIDPYHRANVFLLSADGTFEPWNDMGYALLSYLRGEDASLRTANPDASFFEWLEYHPFCIGTPGVQGDARYKDPRIVKYADLDLGHVTVLPGQLGYVRLKSHPDQTYLLNTTDFAESSKGPDGAVAFVWDREGGLWIHEHGSDGFVHASATGGRKVLCSGMFVAKDGQATCITNESGHYAPQARNIWYFVYRLVQNNCVAAGCTVEISHSSDFADGSYPVATFYAKALARFGAPG